MPSLDVHPFFYPFPSSTGTQPHFAGHTLLLPVVSVGSVPQLAIDLLLHSPALQLRKVARLDHSDCVPFAGPDEGQTSGSGITTALEVFQNDDRLTVVQIRSPVVKSREAAFVHRLVAWIRSARFKEVVVLSSIDAAARTDAELSTPLLTLPATPTPTPTLTALTSRLPRFHPRPPRSHLPASRPRSSHTGPIPPIPGGGITRSLLAALSHPTEPTNTGPNADADADAAAAAAVLLFCAEGDNRPDAHLLAHTVGEALATETAPIEDQLVEPSSWAGVFGAPLDQSMYG